MHAVSTGRTDSKTYFFFGPLFSIGGLAGFFLLLFPPFFDMIASVLSR